MCVCVSNDAKSPSLVYAEIDIIFIQPVSTNSLIIFEYTDMSTYKHNHVMAIPLYYFL